MSDSNALKDKTNTKTLNLVLLTVATAGIFPLMWIYKHCAEIEQLTKTKISSNVFIIWLAVCVGLGGAFTGSGDITLEVIALAFNLGSWVLYIMWAFKAKTALQSYALDEHKTYLRMNSFYTFLFTLYYINYCINDLPEEVRKQQVVSGASSTAV